MDSSLLGYTLTRAIPDSVVHKVLSGVYTVSGGVIRNHAGHIVAHLIEATPSLITGGIGGVAQAAMGGLNAYQLHRLGQQVFGISNQLTALQTATNGIAALAKGTAMLSGLNLAVAVAGFAVLNKRFSKIEKGLKEMAVDVRAIKTFLNQTQHAQLTNALNTLSGIDESTSQKTRIPLLAQTFQTLGEIHQWYCAQIETVEDYAEASAIEESFAVTALARARCSMELENFTAAEKDLKGAIEIWGSAGRRLAKSFLEGAESQNFLTRKYAGDVSSEEKISAADLIEWFDFLKSEPELDVAGGEVNVAISVVAKKSGLDWIDELRAKRQPLQGYLPWKKKVGVEEKAAITLVRRLSARKQVFDGYQAQYKWISKNKKKPSVIEAEIRGISANEKADSDFWFFIDPNEFSTVR